MLRTLKHFNLPPSDLALNLEKHPVFSSWLPVQRKVGLNRRNPRKYSQLLCKTERLKGNAIPYFVKTLNNYYYYYYCQFASMSDGIFP